MDVEVERLKADMTVTRQITKAQMHFCEGTLKNQPVVVVRSGIGKVNAAVCTQILVDEFGVDAVINTGIAGSLNAQIDIGDIVISTDVLHHDMDAVNFGYAPQTDSADGGILFRGRRADGRAGRKCVPSVNPEIKVFRGRVVSGDQFISDRATKDRITKRSSTASARRWRAQRSHRLPT